MTFLLDVSVMIALIDPRHVWHDPAHRWLKDHQSDSWATCPITENGVIRIVGNPRYPNSPGTSSGVIQSVLDLRELSNHVSWADDISLMSPGVLDPRQMLRSGQVTDVYLLALAKAHGGQLATFDQKVYSAAVIGGIAALHIIRT